MPAAPRPRGKARNIAYKVMGKPQNVGKKTPAQEKIDQMLVFQETTRVR